MSSPVDCQKCGKPVPAGSPGGICPACLMQAGLDSVWVDLGTRTHHSPAGSASGSGFVPPPVDQLAPLFPQLELVRVLGVGGMGAVYLARQKSLDRLVALKIIRPESAGALGFADRFAREARALARLNHPGIVGVHDFGPVSVAPAVSPNPSPLFFLLMEYVDGTNLRQLIAEKNLAPREALAIVPQICEALQFAHDLGVVHRDIKPENILLDQRGRVKIADFGLAKLTSNDPTDQALTGTHQIMGTPRYMAPEQLEQSRTIDHRADIYSLGVVFYEMLTGEIPMGMFDPPSKKVQVDVRLDQVVLRSLAREPDRRYQHASEVKTDVESVVNEPGPVRQDTRVAEDFPRPDIGEPEPRLLSPAATAWIWYLQLATCLLGVLTSTVPMCSFSGNFWGFDAGVSQDGSYELLNVKPGSPAWNAGFRSGDVSTTARWTDADLEFRNLANGRGKKTILVRRGEETVHILAESVETRLATVGYLSGWYPVAGFVFLGLGLFVFVSGRKSAVRSWQSILLVIVGSILLIGDLVGPNVSGQLVVWQHPDLPIGRLPAANDEQPFFIFVASLALTVLAIVGIRRRQSANKVAVARIDVVAMVAGPATALTVVAWLAIPALVITPLVLILIVILLDGAGF